MPLIYSFVSRGTTVLADYTAYTGNFSVVAIQVHPALQHCALRRAGVPPLRPAPPRRARSPAALPAARAGAGERLSGQ
jgi:hypothetical protein